MTRRDECLEDQCGHSPEAHHLETRSTGEVETSFVTWRGACTMPFCNCTCYVPETQPGR